MTNLDRAYKAKDEAALAVAKLDEAYREALNACEAAVSKFADFLDNPWTTLKPLEKFDALQAIGNLLSDLADCKNTELEAAYDLARGNLENAEALDLQKSAVR